MMMMMMMLFPGSLESCSLRNSRSILTGSALSLSHISISISISHFFVFSHVQLAEEDVKTEFSSLR